MEVGNARGALRHWNKARTLLRKLPAVSLAGDRDRDSKREAALALAPEDAHAAREEADWGNYRLTDVENFVYLGAQNYSMAQVAREYRRKWPSSIATEYLGRVPHAHGISPSFQNERDNVMCQIARERGMMQEVGPAVPSPDTLVVHLRVGDVTDVEAGGRAATSGAALFEHGTAYVKARSYYECVVAQLPPTIHNVTILGWSHHLNGGLTSGGELRHKQRPKNTNEYRALVSNWFSQQGFRVSHRWEHTPDEDFIYMTHAQHFIYGGGGFSDLIGKCIHRFGGTTYGHAYRPCQ